MTDHINHVLDLYELVDGHDQGLVNEAREEVDRLDGLGVRIVQLESVCKQVLAAMDHGGIGTQRGPVSDARRRLESVLNKKETQ